MCPLHPAKDWFVAGLDDFQLRVFNYDVHEKISAFEAHPAHSRCFAVHPTLSIMFAGCNDMTIKAWDWDKQWMRMRVFESHTHHVMNLVFNPKETNTFTSSCLAQTVKMVAGIIAAELHAGSTREGWVQLHRILCGCGQAISPDLRGR